MHFHLLKTISFFKWHLEPFSFPLFNYTRITVSRKQISLRSDNFDQFWSIYESSDLPARRISFSIPNVKRSDKQKILTVTPSATVISRKQVVSINYITADWLSLLRGSTIDYWKALRIIIGFYEKSTAT